MFLLSRSRALTSSYCDPGTMGIMCVFFVGGGGGGGAVRLVKAPLIARRRERRWLFSEKTAQARELALHYLCYILKIYSYVPCHPHPPPRNARREDRVWWKRYHIKPKNAATQSERNAPPPDRPLGRCWPAWPGGFCACFEGRVRVVFGPGTVHDYEVHIITPLPSQK